MAWKFPKRIPRTGQVVDHRDFADGLVPFIEEDGRLNEQNWSSDLYSQLDRKTDLDEDVAWRLVTGDAFENPYRDVLSSTFTSGSNSFAVQHATRTWQVVDRTNLRMEFTSRGGSLYVIWGAQMIPLAPLTLGTAAIPFLVPGIRVDGVVYPVSCAGSLDVMSRGENMEVGLSGANAFVVDVAIPELVPGRHVVEAVVKVESPWGKNSEGAQNIDFTALTGFVLGSREMLVWEAR